MNERVTFVLAALAGELSASLLIYFIAPTGPLCVAFPTLLSYAGQHGPLAAIVWLTIWTGTWLSMGPRAMRPRQNLSTKIRLLTTLGIVGIVIDNMVSVYQYANSAESTAGGGWSSSVLISLVERSLTYAVVFAAVALLSYLVSLTRKQTETPPPNFGRE